MEVGNTTEGVRSVVETRYPPCACSPLGKVERVSRPYAPGTAEGSKLWTVYTYDSLGRTRSVAQPSGSGTTVYDYIDRTVTVTDPALKKRKFGMDAVGNLVKVTEDPGVLNYLTTYEYNGRGQLTHVAMGVQHRWFYYDKRADDLHD